MMKKTLIEIKKNQRFVPNFGYTAPKKHKKCPNPAFGDHRLHRVGIFAERYEFDGLPGYSCQKKCVNCGEEFGRVFIAAGKRWPELYEKLYYDELIQVNKKNE